MTLATRAYGESTWFAPAGRAPRKRLDESAKAILAHPVSAALFDAADILLMVLNQQRQIVGANVAVRELVNGDTPGGPLGSRPGEALLCRHASDGPDGCGTGRYCASCGAVLAVLESQETGAPAFQDCLMSVERNGKEEAREYRVKASPLDVDGERLTIISLRDISAEKRRDALERVFLHDLMNTLGGLFGWSALLRDSVSGEEEREMAERILFLGKRLRSEVQDHRALLAAEAGSLEPQLVDTSPTAVMTQLESIYREHPAAKGRRIDLDLGDGRALRTDPTLLARVVGNMLKNALEATPRGERVVLRTRGDAHEARLSVWNTGVMPPDVQLQVFNRSFSTKAASGRGLGTFGMKLFGERYLGGRVAFTSSEAEGTTFSITLPRR